MLWNSNCVIQARNFIEILIYNKIEEMSMKAIMKNQLFEEMHFWPKNWFTTILSLKQNSRISQNCLLLRRHVWVEENINKFPIFIFINFNYWETDVIVCKNCKKKQKRWTEINLRRTILKNTKYKWKNVSQLEIKRKGEM